MDPDTTALESLADRIVALVHERAAATVPDASVEADVHVSHTRHGLTRFANSFIHQHVGEDTRAVQLTIAVDGRTASTSTTAVDVTTLPMMIDATIASAARQPVDPHWPGATPPDELTTTSRFDPATADGDPDARARQVRAFVDAGEGLSAAGYLDTAATWDAFASTAGQRVSGASTRATIDGIHQTGTSAGSAHQSSARLADLDGAAAGALAADRARRSATFTDIDPGSYEVVLGPEAVATVLTFLGFYGFNAKAHLEGASFAQLSSPQFDPQITILDDPDDPRALGLPFDAEGSARRRTVVVDGGTTAALTHDRRTALRIGATTTGGAVPGGEAMGAFPMNLRLAAGDRSPDTLIAGVERGLLVTTFNYVRILDPKTQVSTGLTRNGTFLIEDGEVVGAVGNLRFTQSFLAALAPGNVLGIGDDDRLADGEFGPGMVICPSLHLASWAFTGGARG